MTDPFLRTVSIPIPIPKSRKPKHRAVSGVLDETPDPPFPPLWVYEGGRFLEAEVEEG